MSSKLISIVVVCYQDAGSILVLLQRLTKIMADITPYEIIYVNDHSPDDSEKILIAQAKHLPQLTVISHARNFGAQAAFDTGMRQARGDAVILMDGDLQDPPELLSDFIRLWKQGYDIVYGIRAKRSENWFRRLGYKLFYLILEKIAYVPIVLDAGDFSLMDRVVVDVILDCPEKMRFIRGLRGFVGFKHTGVSYNRSPRFAGDTTQSLFDYFLFAYQSLVSFSLVPLRAITLTAFILCFTFLVVAGFYLAGFLSKGHFLDTNEITLVLVLGLAAINMLALGIMGEYLGHIFIETKKRPAQVISLLLNDHRSQPLDWCGRIKK